MDKGIYTALSGGIAKSHELEIIANNLANSNTTAFKKDAGTFNEYLTELRRPDSAAGLEREINSITIADPRPQGDKSFVEMDGVYTDFRQGGLQQTHQKLDLALDGRGFFEVLTPGGVRYTRQGNFSLSPEGKLITQNGFPVLSKPNKAAGGEAAGGSVGTIGVAVPPKPLSPRNPSATERQITLGPGPITITEDGIVFQNGTRVAELNVEEFEENQLLEKVGNSYFRNVSDQNLKDTQLTTKVRQGFLEGSNVNAVSEMTKLIQATRAYESHMQAVKTYQDIDGRTASEIARVMP